jgi:hypothetical protein
LQLDDTTSIRLLRCCSPALTTGDDDGWRNVVKFSKTPVLDGRKGAGIIDTIPTSMLRDLRDQRADRHAQPIS